MARKQEQGKCDAEAILTQTFSKNRDSVPTPCLLASTTEDSFWFSNLGFFCKASNQQGINKSNRLK